MSENTTPTPTHMPRHFHRADYKNGQLTVVFTDVAHIVDSMNFAANHGHGAAFENALMSLVTMALGAAVPRGKFTYPDGTVREAAPGNECKITISPDSFDRPSLAWFEEPGMTGGMIWHGEGEWRIHT